MNAALSLASRALLPLAFAAVVAGCTPKTSESGARGIQDNTAVSASTSDNSTLSDAALEALPLLESDDSPSDGPADDSQAGGSSGSDEWIDVPENQQLNCIAPRIPMIERFPEHIFAKGAASTELLLYRSWFAWWTVPVLPESTRRVKTSCSVQAQDNQQKALVCTYRHTVHGDRTVTIPLRAKRKESAKTPGFSPTVWWVVEGAKVEGKKLHKDLGEVDLECSSKEPPLAPVKGQPLPR